MKGAILLFEKTMILPQSPILLTIPPKTHLYVLVCQLHIVVGIYINSVAWVCERTLLSERPLLVGEVSADRGCHVVSVTESYGRILGFLDWSRYFFFEVAPQLPHKAEWTPVPVPLLLRKSGSAGNRTQTSGSVGRNCDHWTTEVAVGICIAWFKSGRNLMIQVTP
jgi:hypothetical protein